MGVPAQRHHIPVGLVAIHGDLHASAAGGDTAVKGAVVKGCQRVLQLLNIFQGGGGGNVAAVQQNMAAHPVHTLGLGLLQHGDQMMDIAVHIAVGEQAQEMQRSALAFTPPMSSFHAWEA